MDDINGLLTVKSIRKRLSCLPSNAQEAYRNTFGRIMNQQRGLRDLALRALSWIQNAQRPISMTELQHALATYDDMSDPDPEDLPSAKIILLSCQGLLVLSEVDRTVGIVHSTATEFLNETPDGLDKTPDLTIARVCLSYLSVGELAKGPCASIDELEQRHKRLPFLDYSARFFGYHVRRCEEQCIGKLSIVLHEDNLLQSAWQILNFTVGFDSPLAQEMFRSGPSRASALHCAAFWGFAKYLAMALEEGGSSAKRPCPLVQKRNLNGVDSHAWTPLHWAASMGHTEAARTLLDAGALVDEPDMAGWTPLFWAAFKGHLDLVRLLKSRNAVTSLFDRSGFAPLHWAMCADHAEVATILLPAGDIHLKAEPGSRTRLDEFCEGTWTKGGLHLRELSVLKAKELSADNLATGVSTFADLYTEGADTRAFSAVFENLATRFAESYTIRGFRAYNPSRWDRLVYNVFSYRTKPSFAILRIKDQSERLQILRRKFFAKMMEHAVRLHSLPAVKLLLDLKLVTVASSETSKLLCSAASVESSDAVVAEFIAQGVDVNQKDSWGLSPLHIACERACKATVVVILGAEEVDVDARDSKQNTPLMLLLGRKYDEKRLPEIQQLAELLILKGASASVRNAEGESAMHFAMGAWCPGVIKLLLDSGADMNARDFESRTPLYFLATASSAEVSLVSRPVLYDDL